MIKRLALGAFAWLALSAGAPANAASYNFSFSLNVPSGPDYAIAGIITTGGLDSGGSGGYDITGISGHFSADGGTTNYSFNQLDSPGTCCGGTPNDNLFFYPPDPSNATTPGYLSYPGLAFFVSGYNAGDDVNLYYVPFDGSYGLSDDINPDGYGGGTFTASPTPLPATLPLFAGGLGMIGLLGARKRRKARAA